MPVLFMWLSYVAYVLGTLGHLLEIGGKESCNAVSELYENRSTVYYVERD